MIDTSSVIAPGSVIIGSQIYENWMDPAFVDTALVVELPESATIASDAFSAGSGGQVLIWSVCFAPGCCLQHEWCRSEQQTAMSGQIKARGGLLYGAGGFCEVSSRNHLQSDGSVRLHM